MTLYWWMHWFWITTVIFQVLLLIHASSLPLAPLVQNGHQNGPYLNELPARRELSTLPSQLSTVSEPNANYLLKDLSRDSRNINVTQITTLFHQSVTRPHALISDHITTEPPDGPASASYKVTTHDATVGKGKDKFTFKNEDIPTTEMTVPSTATFLLPDTIDNDDIDHTSLQNGPPVDSSSEKADESWKIMWNDKFPGRVVGIHSKHLKAQQTEEKTTKESLLEEIPMGDGPYNPTGSFINSTNIRVKTVLSTSKTPEMTTVKESHFLSTDGDIEAEGRDNITTHKILLFVTPTTVTDHSENVNNVFHSTEKNHGDSNITDSATEHILEESYNSTFIVGDNTTVVAKTDVTLQESLNKSKVHQENTISAINFDHSNIEESTKVSSSIVQSVIDENVNSRGKSLNAVAITGIVMGIIVGVGLIGAVSCIVYRRRYLNNPQTLNDKCSNPDSSGYIDDSTLRENSEEMYSLDNDSFLNSLEAMTIQNYWTDNVKHTKL